MIYLDNAATTFPKPDCVINTMCDFLRLYGGNPGRGGHYFSRKSAEKIYECRELFAKLISADNPEHIIFTKNATEAINLAIKGSVKRGDEIIISSMEHNSVLRSCIDLEKEGITVKIARADSDGYVSENSIIPLISERTRLICIIHASNVVGTVNPVKKICEAARKKGVLTLIDAAQTAGIIEVNSSWADMIAFAGHKALYGPFGTGALYISASLKLDTLIEGGTGSMSESALMPDMLPDRFEAGTLNACGIAGLSEGIRFVTSEGAGEKELENGKILMEKLSSVKDVRIVGNPGVGVVGCVLKNHDCVDIASRLDSEYSIAVRAGLHCAPMAHRSLGTVTKGMLRFSTGYFNTEEEITSCVHSLEKILLNTN